MITGQVVAFARRFQYRGLYVPNPESTFQLPASFVERLMQLERTWDFIGEREMVLPTRDKETRD
jgi:hypothetical protein